MSDAEIIPIGTRGRPGRGTGKAPSSAARSLAGGSGKPGRPAQRRTSEGAEPTVPGAAQAETPAQDDAPTAPATEQVAAPDLWDDQDNASG